MKFVPIIIVVFVLLAVSIGLWLWTPDKSRSILQAKYLNAPGDIVEILGTHLHVRDSGAKTSPAIILLHGFGSSLQTWDAWASVLQNDHRVVRFDLPGSGLSEPDPTGDYTDARTLALIGALMDRLQIDQASVIGNSIGGRIAWKFAAEYPQRVRKLVLISPDGFASAGFGYGDKHTVPASIKLMRYFLPKTLVRQSIASAYGNPSALTEETLDRYYDLMRAPGVRQAMIERMEQTVLLDPEPLLRKISAPTLLVWGEKDALIPFGNADDYLRDIRDARLVSFPELGHVPQEEAPALSVQPVQSFLAQ
ncbi:MAG: alpha/beta hydrolase [Xanthobacteraceae bacterium]